MFGENKKRDSRGTLRDYKKEYKKYGSSTKAKKYRAELNQYNRKKGTYGNGDGKDASHKSGKIVGFESQSKNRGRAEKSRLKKESVLRDLNNSTAKNFASWKSDVLKLSKKLPNTEKSKVHKDITTLNKLVYNISKTFEKNLDESVNEAKKLFVVRGMEEFTGKEQEISTPLEKSKANALIQTILKQQKQSGMDIYTKMKLVPVNESDLGLTLKKGKTITVTHKKSGKELVIIDKPNVRKEYEKIGYFAEGRVHESTDAYQKSLEKIASDKKLNMISKKDRETLKKIAQMMSKNEGKMSPEKVYDYFLYMRKYKPDIWKDMKKNKDVKKIMKKFESVTEVFRLTESGIMYRAGVKKYGKEGMRKIQSAAGKGLGHAEIGKIKDQYDKKKKKKKSESIDELTLTEGSVFDINNAEQMVKVLTAGLKKVAPDLKPGNIHYSTLGGDDRVSIVGKFSLDRKKDWSRGILENSRWITFYLDNDGSLEVNVMGYPFDMRKQVKMRKSRNKDIKQVLARMLKHFNMLNTKYPQGLS